MFDRDFDVTIRHPHAVPDDGAVDHEPVVGEDLSRSPNVATLICDLAVIVAGFLAFAVLLRLVVSMIGKLLFH